VNLGAAGEKGSKASPKALGLKDGSVLAFRFREGDEEDGDEGDEGETEGEKGEKFWVEWSSYDDAYGEPEPTRGGSMDMGA
jgi:hypothetical protein